MELVTGYMEPDGIRAEIAALAAILDRYGARVLKLELGGNCSLSTHLRGKETELPPSALASFVEQCESAGIIRLGWSEFVIASIPDEITFELCEMSEIHCLTENINLYNMLSDRWCRYFTEAHELRRDVRQLRKLSGEVWESYTLPE